jgi:hypothetical protein
MTAGGVGVVAAARAGAGARVAVVMAVGEEADERGIFRVGINVFLELGGAQCAVDVLEHGPDRACASSSQALRVTCESGLRRKR